MVLIGEIIVQLPDHRVKVLDNLQVASLTFPRLEQNADRLLRALTTYRRSVSRLTPITTTPLLTVYVNLREQAPLASLGVPEGCRL